MKYIIYGIRNKLDDKFYVGRTGNLRRRWQQHLHRNKSGVSRTLYGAMNRNGRGNFELLELAHVNNEMDGVTMERIWVALLNSIHPNGYNLSTGGAGGGIPCDETRRMISNANRGRPSYLRSEETLQKQRKAQQGHPGWNKGKPRSAETRKKISIALTGRPLTTETRRKIGDAMRGVPFSVEHRNKIAAAMTGKSPSIETRKKISESLKQRK